MSSSSAMARSRQPGRAARSRQHLPRMTIPAFAYLLPSVVPALVFLSPDIVPYGTAFAFLIVFMPILEMLAGNSAILTRGVAPPTRGKTHKPALHDTPAFRFVLLAHTFLCLAATGYAILRLPVTFASTLWPVMVVLDLGCVFICIAVSAHELNHKVGSTGTAFDRMLGWLALSVVLNPAYHADHPFHHRHVGTEEDGASAPRGMNVYEHIVRMEFTAWRHALGLRALPASCGGSDSTASGWSRGVRRSFMAGATLSVGLVCAVAAARGGLGARVYMGGGVVGICFLDCANYAEHYGLRRRKVAAGARDTGGRRQTPAEGTDGEAVQYEPVGPAHSWDTSNVVSNLLFFQVGRHADHHMDGTMPYPLLDCEPDAPEYPYGLVTMSILSFVPGWFSRVADPLLDSHEKGAQLQ